MFVRRVCESHRSDTTNEPMVTRFRGGQSETTLTHRFTKLPERKTKQLNLAKDSISNIVKRVVRRHQKVQHHQLLPRASSTKAYRMGKQLAPVMQQARWSSERVFRQHYLRGDGRPILVNESSLLLLLHSDSAVGPK